MRGPNKNSLANAAGNLAAIAKEKSAPEQISLLQNPKSPLRPRESAFSRKMPGHCHIGRFYSRESRRRVEGSNIHMLINMLKESQHIQPEKIMRLLALACLSLSLCLACTGVSVLARPNLKNLNKPILLDAGKLKRMYVTFNHSSHQDIACRTCHHEGLPGNRYAACTSEGCHSLPGASERSPMSVFMAYHAPGTDRSCYGCHKPLGGKYPNFHGCSPCHKTMMGNVAVREASSPEQPK